MTNKPNDVRVSRELLQNIVNYMEGSASSQVRVWRKQLINQLAQPADQQVEPVPVAWMRFDDDQRAIFTRSKRSKCSEPLYAHPTAYRRAPLATANLVLPERMKWGGLRATACNIRSEGWNACLDEIAKLNGGQS